MIFFISKLAFKVQRPSSNLDPPFDILHSKWDTLSRLARDRWFCLLPNGQSTVESSNKLAEAKTSLARLISTEWAKRFTVELSLEVLLSLLITPTIVHFFQRKFQTEYFSFIPSQETVNVKLSWCKKELTELSIEQRFRVGRSVKSPVKIQNPYIDPNPNPKP